MDAIDGLEHFLHEVGNGAITAHLTVNQVYAHRQHVEKTWKHPRGGMAGYLEGPLELESALLFQMMADHLVSATGSDIVEGMIGVSEKMNRMVEDNAPRKYEILRYSGHPQVYDNDRIVYDRPPKQERRRDK